MRIKAFALGTALLFATCVLADDFKSVPARPTVFLSGPTSLSALRKSNPNHYARAERIMAAANELCQPGPPHIDYARFDAREISCASAVFKTSNPPKKSIEFTLDDTHYIALVTLTDFAPQAIPVR